MISKVAIGVIIVCSILTKECQFQLQDNEKNIYSASFDKMGVKIPPKLSPSLYEWISGTAGDTCNICFDSCIKNDFGCCLGCGFGGCDVKSCL